jgi:hypothetical protein
MWFPALCRAEVVLPLANRADLVVRIMEIPAALMARPTACPTNYLAARENYQVAKYKLRRTEDELMAKMGVTTLPQLETLLVHETFKPGSPFAALIQQYNRQHAEFAAADQVFEAATDLQRRRIAEADAAEREMARDLTALEC